MNSLTRPALATSLAGEHCSVRRPQITCLPKPCTPVESQLLLHAPPPGLDAAHSPGHLLSFYRHLQGIVERPVTKNVGKRMCWVVLGLVVFTRAKDGTFECARWDTDPERTGDGLIEFLPWEKQIIDLPRTDFWKDAWKQVFQAEAHTRTGQTLLADQWSEWAWSLLEQHYLNGVDLRRLRSRIRRLMGLDWKTVSLLTKIRRAGGGAPPTLCEYNACHRDRLALDELWRLSRLFAVLWSKADVPEQAASGSREPAARLKQACTDQGIKPAQWRLLADGRAPMLPLFKSFVVEFASPWSGYLVADFLGVVRILEPSIPIDLPVWRRVVAVAGTCNDQPDRYAGALQRVGKTLEHIVSLVERKKCPVDLQRRDAELHQICNWVSDHNISRLSRTQRQQGWSFLFKKARRYAMEKQRLLELQSLHWQAPEQPVRVGAYTAVALANGLDLWEEASAMRHCAERYAQACAKGIMLLFSVRRDDGARCATFSLSRNGGAWSLRETSGPGHKAVGRKFDGLIAAVIDRLQTAPNTAPLAPSAKRYRLLVRSNHDYEDSWTEGEHAGKASAIRAAEGICRAGLTSRDARGRMAWLEFGETPTVEALGGAADVGFSAHEYIDRLCSPGKLAAIGAVRRRRARP